MENAQFELNITHLYPEKMNLYGDLGNVITLKKRAEWRGIKVNINNINIGYDIEKVKTDLYFMGGGQDRDQLDVYQDLVKNKKNKLLTDLESNIPMLAICGGYQLLGEYFLSSNNERIEGIGFLPIETVAPGPELKQRAIGNLITKLSQGSPINEHYSGLNTLIGFENHSGRTRIKEGSDLQVLGRVLIGEGDNDDGISDGILYKNTVGTYMHGSVLPKNPHLADFLLLAGLENKYKHTITLGQLDDNEEIIAHKYMLKRYNQA